MNRLRFALLAVITLPFLAVLSPVIAVVLYMTAKMSETAGDEYLSGNKDRE